MSSRCTSTAGRPTKNLFGEDRLRPDRRGSLFLNLSTAASWWTTTSLRTHIEAGHIAGAARDVFPARAEGPRRTSSSRSCAGLPNVILTPHIGGSTEEAQQDIGALSSPASSVTSYPRGATTSMSVNLPGLALPQVPETQPPSSTCTATCQA